MKFNQYTWNLYKQSPNGQKSIKEFEESSNNATAMDLVFKYNPRMKLWLDNVTINLWKRRIKRDKCLRNACQ